MSWSTAAAGTVIPGCQDGGCDARRTGRRPARRGHRSPRPGVRAGRGGHRQDAHDHPPHRAPGAAPGTSRPGRCWRSRSPRGRRARCAPGCARSASRACRRARSTPPRCASCATSGRGSSAVRRGSWSRASCASSGRPRAGRRWAPTPPRCATWRARSSGRRPASSPPRSTRPRWRGCAATCRAPPSRWRPSTRATRRPRTRAELLDFDDLLLHVAARPRGARRHRAGVPRPLPLLRRRRVPGRHPAAAAGARRVARRARRPHRGRRRQPDDLHVRRARARSTCWSSRGASPRPSSCGCSATTAPPRRSSGAPTRSSARPATGPRAPGCG